VHDEQSILRGDGDITEGLEVPIMIRKVLNMWCHCGVIVVSLWRCVMLSQFFVIMQGRTYAVNPFSLR
jgi:hypothetical protein